MPARLRLSWGMKTLKLFLLSGARIFRIRSPGHPLCPDLCLGLLPATNLIGLHRYIRVAA